MLAANRSKLPVSLIVVLASALPSAGHAQSDGGVGGIVTEADGSPLGGVVVTVEGLGIAVATGATGRYSLSRVPGGQHLLRFRRIGYGLREVAVTVTAGTTAGVDVVLDLQPIELGSVLVEGVSRAPDRMLDAPAAVDVVRPATADALSLTGHVPLALTRVPGLDVAQGGVTDFNVNARGFMTMLTRKMLVLQDGRDLGTGLIGFQIWGVLSEPLEDLGRIEVIRGPGSALYGADAYTGVINITTPAARDVVGTKFTFGGGELGTARADVRHAGEWLHGRLGYRVNVGYTQSGDWTRSRTAKDGSDWKQEYAPATSTPPPSTKPDSLPLFGQTKDPVTGRALGTPDPLVTAYGSGRIDYYTSAGSTVTLEGGTAAMDNAVLLSGSARNQHPRVLRPWARLAWVAKGSDVSAWYSGLSLPIVNLTSGTRGYDDERIFHLEGRTSRTFHGNSGRVTIGASVEDDNINASGFGDRSDQYYGAFTQLEYGVGRVRVIGAVRWDDNDLFPSQLSPKGALVFSPTRNHALRLTVDRAFLTPNLLNLFGTRSAGGAQDLSAIEAQLRANPSVGPALLSVPFGTLFDRSSAVPESTFGNPHVVPQTVTSYAVGYKGQLGRRVFVTLDAYAAHMQNFLTGLLGAGTTRLNPDFHAWTAPSEVAVADRAAVESAVGQAVAAAHPNFAGGLTRLANGTTAIVFSFGNVGTVDEWGVELGTSVSLTRALTSSASYTWYNFAIRQNVVRNVLAPNTPTNKGTVAVDYAGREGLDIGVDVRIVGGYHWSSGSWVGDVPPSQTVNATAGYRVSPHLRVFASGTDLFDQRTFEVYGGAVIGRRVLAGVTSTF